MDLIYKKKSTRKDSNQPKINQVQQISVMKFSDNDAILKNMFTEADNRVGIIPNTAENIRQLMNAYLHPNFENDNDSMVFKSQEYY